ncbi:MAG TPA: nucleoside phosphorylase [Bacteroidales bacterium]|mgnify:CR=1 FL=1|nr:nucleoside phosphorylase [Bacteroidales bacterium]HPS17005.1 nucleoside phosphorylase [Bacteroidales bacterium]
MKKIADSELILNPDGSVYHLKLRPENISDTILLVGDQGRVETISKYFTNIECKIQSREFLTHTGTYNGKRITALSTGIGTDNIDIVINELDALVNIDLKNRCIKEKLTSLNIVRLGTSGALQGDIPVDNYVMSEYGLGFDGLLNFYKTNKNIFETEMADAFVRHSEWSSKLAYPYVVKASDMLMKKLGEGLFKGITATASGFYGPQGRQLRIEPLDVELNDKMQTFQYKNNRITNFEMETSALYGLGAVLGHNTLTICTIIANRVIKQFSEDYKKPVEKMIQLVLDRITA